MLALKISTTSNEDEPETLTVWLSASGELYPGKQSGGFRTQDPKELKSVWNGKNDNHLRLKRKKKPCH